MKQTTRYSIRQLSNIPDIQYVMNSPFACNMTALDKQQRDRHTALANSLFHVVHEIKELKNGYAFLLSANSDHLLITAEFIFLERLCCPFFNFNIELTSGNNTFLFSITGDEGIKPFIIAELGVHFPKPLLQSYQAYNPR